MSGVDLVTVKEILGHSTIEMTVRYAHPSDVRKMAAVEQLVSKTETEKEEKKYRVDGHNLVTVPDEEQTSRIVTH